MENRPTSPLGPSEIRQTERWLASARASLAVSALFAIWTYPTEISWWAQWLLGLYLIHSTLVMLLFRFHKQSTSAFRALVHTADVVWPAVIYVFATGERNLFFLFFVFVLAAAAYRWGLWETVGTAAASLSLLWLESLVVFQKGFLASLDRFLVQHHWHRLLGVDVGELEPKRLLIRSVYLLVMGWLLGYLAEQYKQLRVEVERGRVVRELHDGTLQSLLAMEMRLNPLRRQLASQVPVAEELRQIQDVLRQEAQKIRDFMQQTKPLDVDAKNLRPRIREVVERFERETGIGTQMVFEPAEVDLSRWVCGVVLRILQEALANVRKHSKANNVLVQFGRTGKHWQLAVEDNGGGFPFSGRFSLTELEASGRAPLVIKECVLSIGGELMIEVIPGRVSRLEITIPAKRRAAYWRNLSGYLVSVGRWTYRGKRRS
jgi:signal transduction histidine kinase